MSALESRYDPAFIASIAGGIGKHDTCPYSPEQAIEIITQKSCGFVEIEDFKQRWAGGEFDFDSCSVYGIYLSPQNKYRNILMQPKPILNPHMNEFVDFLRVSQPTRKCETGHSYPREQIGATEEAKGILNREEEIREIYGGAALIYPSVALSHINPRHLTAFCIPPNVVGYRMNCQDPIDEAVTSHEFQLLLDILQESEMPVQNIVFITGMQVE
jgi:hypothetical protein